MRNRFSAAFTLIELLIALALSLLLATSFFKVFNKTAALDQRNSEISSVSVKGDHIINSLDSAFRLIGLGNSLTEFIPDPNDLTKPNEIITVATGLWPSSPVNGSPSGAINFTFQSPFGGPVTQVYTSGGDIAACSLTLKNSSNLFTGNAIEVRIISPTKVYSTTATVTASTGNNRPAITTGNLTPTPGATENTCLTAMPPDQTVFTFRPKRYQLIYGNNGTILQELPWDGGSAREIFNYTKNQMPMFVLQFLVETVNPSDGVVSRTWVASVSDETQKRRIKALRFGFVLATDQSDVAVAAGNHCVFDVCFAPTDTTKRYATFSRLVYLRNIDYLQRNNIVDTYTP